VKPFGKKPARSSRRQWEDNIKMDLKEVGFMDREKMELAVNVRT
jgi:hypothetical protein